MSLPGFSDELQAMFRPVATYDALGQRAEARWPWLRRPVLLLAVTAGSLSLMTSGKLWLPLFIDAAVCWSFVPLLHFTAAAVLAKRWGTLSVGGTIDLYFVGFGPWYLFLLALTGIELVTGGLDSRTAASGAGLALAWSAGLTFVFLRRVFERSPLQALWAVACLKAFTWGLPLLFFWLTDQLTPRILAAL